MLNNHNFTRERTKYLGGSDIGAILGLSKYRSCVDVWLEKTGKSLHEHTSLPLRFGQFAEEFVAREYALATACQLARHEAAISHPHYTYMQGHIDRFVLENDLPLLGSNGQLQARRILECKTASPFAQSDWGDAGTDQVPLSYLVQCAWYMMLCQVRQTDLAVLFGNSDFRIYTLHRDAELEKLILERAIQFWEEHVIKDIPPKPVSQEDYQQLFSKSKPGKAIEADSETSALIQQWKDIQQHAQGIEHQMSETKQRIMAYMQDAEILTWQGEIVATWKTPKASSRVDTKKLAEEHPDLIAHYQVPLQTSRRFIIKPS